MAVTTVGFDNADITEAGFSKLMQYATFFDQHAVRDGFDTTVGSGTRAVSVSAGTAVGPGVLLTETAATTVTLAANSSGSVRMDYVVLSINWTTNVTTVTSVTGSSATAPTLTQTAGSVWQIPLARVRVANGATAVAASDITICKPLPGSMRVFRGSDIGTGQVLKTATTGRTISSVTVGDPGRPYRLDCVGALRVSSDAGYGRLSILVNNAQLALNYSGPVAGGVSQPIVATDISGILTGTATVDLSVIGDGVESPLTWGGGANNFLLVKQIYV